MTSRSGPKANRKKSASLPADRESANSIMWSRSNTSPRKCRPTTIGKSVTSACARSRSGSCWCSRIPNYEFRYLKHMLERDSTIQLKTVLQEADLEYAEQDQSALRVFPVRREELFAYDVVIFGDVNPAFFSGSVMAKFIAISSQKRGAAWCSSPARGTRRWNIATRRWRSCCRSISMGRPVLIPGQVVNEPYQMTPTD